MESVNPFPFGDLPEDAQILILSFLNQSDLRAFSHTSSKFSSLCHDQGLWFLKCSRRWGSQTLIQKWGHGRISYKHLFSFLNRRENLIGIWLSSSSPSSPSIPLMLLDWGPFYFVGYEILPSKNRGHGVEKKPFLWVTLTSDGKPLNYLDTGRGIPLAEEDLLREDSEKLRNGLILVDVDPHYGQLSVRENSLFLEFRRRFSSGNGAEESENVYKSAPDGLMAAMYQAVARKVSSCGEERSKKERRKERRRQKEQQQQQKQRVLRWDTLHFRRVRDCSPSPSRPLQGLWKGTSPGKGLCFYLVSYYDWGDISFEKLECSSTTPTYFYYDAIFTSSIEVFVDPPFSPDEDHTYSSRRHIGPPTNTDKSYNVIRMFYANSGHFSEKYVNPDDADGRVWLYADGTFGFGFLHDDHIVDLKPVVKNGYIY